jgi:hypothetical protein
VSQLLRLHFDEMIIMVFLHQQNIENSCRETDNRHQSKYRRSQLNRDLICWQLQSGQRLEQTATGNNSAVNL